MKPGLNKRAIALLLAISSLALLAGCGQAGNALPGYGYGGIYGGCVPINQTTMIAFQSTGMYIGTYGTDTRVLAGIIPPGDPYGQGTYGTMTVNSNGGIPVTTTPYGGSVTLQGSRVDGTTITLNASSTMPVTTGYTNPATTNQFNATGYVQISPFIQQLMMVMAMGGSTSYGTLPLSGYSGMYPGYNTGYTNSQICVSNIAISMNHGIPGNNILYEGTLYFYLSGGVFPAGSQHGLALDF